MNYYKLANIFGGADGDGEGDEAPKEIPCHKNKFWLFFIIFFVFFMVTLILTGVVIKNTQQDGMGSWVMYVMAILLYIMTLGFSFKCHSSGYKIGAVMSLLIATVLIIATVAKSYNVSTAEEQQEEMKTASKGAKVGSYILVILTLLTGCGMIYAS